MKMKSNNAVLKEIFKELSKYFESCGWKLESLGKYSLSMCQAPRSDVKHSLMIFESPLISDLHSERVVGISCGVDVFFPEVEAVIKQIIHPISEDMGDVSVRLNLNALTPPENLFAKSLHLIPYQDEAFSKALTQFIKDFDVYLEPIRYRMENSDIFLDEDYYPEKINHWTWDLRRLAYFFLHAKSFERDRLVKKMSKKLEVFLENVDDSKNVFFEDLDVLNKKKWARSALEVKKFIDHSAMLRK